MGAKSASIQRLKPTQRSDKLFIFAIARVIRKVEDSHGLSELDCVSRSMLTFIGETLAQDMPVYVQTIIESKRFGTPPTVFGRLAELKERGWIDVRPGIEDRRKRLISLTNQSCRAYSLMSNLATRF